VLIAGRHAVVTDFGVAKAVSESGESWNVFFGPVHLGWLDERDYRIHDRRGRIQRERHLSPIR
jgi:hypothetical protein